MGQRQRRRESGFTTGVSGEGVVTGQSPWVILNSWRGWGVDILAVEVRVEILSLFVSAGVRVFVFVTGDLTEYQFCGWKRGLSSFRDALNRDHT